MRLALILLTVAASFALPLTPASLAEVAPPSSPHAACAQAPAQQDEIGPPPDGDGATRRVSAKDPCAVADDNLARDEAAILKAKPQAAAAHHEAWDHKARPQFLDLIRRRFELQPSEIAVLERIGFAVPARLEMPSYAHAYHEIFQSQLPVYISADSIFHAIFASHDAVVAHLERTRLSPMLDQALADMHCALPAAAKAYPPDVARDLDLYLLVARRLITDAEHQPRSAFADLAVEHEADDLIAKLVAANQAETVTLFGRPRLVDFTQYGPRGHYTANERIQRYFRSAMWASRLEFNLVSRSSRSSAPGPLPDPSETPREALAALALADLATRSGAAKAVADMDAAWAALAGRREDVSIAQLAAMRADVGPLTGPQAFDRLKAAIGDRFRRRVRLHPMPEGSRELPAIATLLGPRIVADAGALMPLVSDAIAGRERLSVADVAYSLGLDRAKAYLAKELAVFPTLDAQFAVARTQAASAPVGDDLYGAWLAAIRALARAPQGAQPSFLAGDAGRDLRMNAVAAAYGQLKHNYALVAGQSYSAFGCEIPDGYVEPVPAAYDALIDYAARGERLVARLDPKDAGTVGAHFSRAGQVLRVLRAIIGDELAGHALTTTQRRWLGMVAELSQDRSQELTGYPPRYTGWYFDLFLSRQLDGMRGADFIADYFTSSKGIAYAGATAPRLGIFVVDTGGPARAFVGPVARAYEVFGPLAQRYTDETAKTLTSRDEPWAASYTIPAGPAPSSLQLKYDRETHALVLTSDQVLGRATIKLLDHHRLPFATLHASVKQGEIKVPVDDKRMDGVYVEIGGFRDFVVADAYGEITGQWGKPPPDQ